jgi:hypothetical protein
MVGEKEKILRSGQSCRLGRWQHSGEEEQIPAACGSGARGRWTLDAGHWTLDASSTTHDLYSRPLANDTLPSYANCPSALETQAPTGGLGFGSTDSDWMLFTTATMHAGCLAGSCGTTQPDLLGCPWHMSIPTVRAEYSVSTSKEGKGCREC